MRNSWFKVSGEFWDTPVKVAVQQHAIFREFIPVPILCGILRPGEPQTRPGTGCHMQRVMPSLLSPPSKPAALEQARAPGQQCESGAGSKHTNTSCCKCVCSPLIYPPSSFGAWQGVIFKGLVLFLRLRARGLWRNVETLQTRAPHQPKPPCLLVQSISSDLRVHLSCGARGFCPPHEEEKKRGSWRHSLPSGTVSPFPSSCSDSLCRHLSPHHAHIPAELFQAWAWPHQMQSHFHMKGTEDYEASSSVLIRIWHYFPPVI